MFLKQSSHEKHLKLSCLLMENFKKEIKKETVTRRAPIKHVVKSVCHNPRKEPIGQSHYAACHTLYVYGIYLKLIKIHPPISAIVINLRANN